MRSTLWAIWLLVPGISFQITISVELRETVEVGLISVCSRNQAAIQIDFSVGALTPRVSVSGHQFVLHRTDRTRKGKESGIGGLHAKTADHPEQHGLQQRNLACRKSGDRHMTDHHTCSMHRLTPGRFDYPSESCVSAELPSVLSNTAILTTASLQNQKITQKELQIEHRRQASKNLGGLGAGPQLLCQDIRHCSFTPFTKNEFKIALF